MISEYRSLWKGAYTMEWLANPSVGFMVVFLGTMFLISEFLVKSKSLFFILGTAFMVLFFSYHLEGAAGIWVLVLYAAGLGLILLDGKLIGDGTVSIVGLLLMGVSIAVPTPTIIYGVLVIFGFLAGAIAAMFFLKVFPRRDLWSKLMLKDSLTSEQGYNSINQTYGGLVGKTGTTVTPFRPTGTIDIEGERYSATSGDQWLNAEEEIEVTSVDGTRIRVKRLETAVKEQ